MSQIKEKSQVPSYDLFQETIIHKDWMIGMKDEIIKNQKEIIAFNSEKIDRLEKIVIEFEHGQNEYRKTLDAKVWAFPLHIVPGNEN